MGGVHLIKETERERKLMAVRLFNEIDWNNLADDNRELYDDYMLEQGKATKTIKQYGFDIRAFMCWLVKEKNNKYILDLKRRDFRNFFLKMQRAGTSAARINRFESSVRNLLEFACISEDYDYEVNAMQHIRGLQKEPVREIVFLTDQQVNILIDELLKRKHYQKALWVSLAFDSAGRRNELHQINKENFLENNQTNTVVGKRGKKFKLIYFNRSKIIYKLYMKQRGEDSLSTLWIAGKDDNKRPLSYEATYDFINEFREILEERTGEKIPVTPHSFRHSSLQAYSDGTHHNLKEQNKEGLDIRMLQALAHHESSQTTEGYLQDNSQEQLANALGIELN